MFICVPWTYVLKGTLWGTNNSDITERIVPWKEGWLNIEKTK